MRLRISTLIALATLFTLPIQAQVDTDIDLQQFATGFDKPVDIANANDQRLFIVEKDGVIRILNSDGSIEPTAFLDIQSLTSTGGNNSEQGLLGLAFHPNYAQNGYFFVNYTRTNGDTRVSRFTVSADPNVADVGSREDILTIYQPYGNHNGGCIKFGHDGYLYVGMGDGGSGEDPLNSGQTMSSLLGKMLRIDVDGALPYEVPASNPFVDAVSDTLPEIWASGIRNPWRFAFDIATGDLWMADVGQYDWEEIDFQPASSAGGENYGWNCYEGNHSAFGNSCPPMSAFTGPVAEFTHDDGHCSISGGHVYRGIGYPMLAPKYFSVDYCSGQFWSTELNDADQFVTFEVTGTEGFGWTTFGLDRWAEMYVANQSEGIIYQIIDASCDGTESTINTDNLPGLMANTGESYQWYLDGVAINGATSQEHTAAENGAYSVLVRYSENCADYSAEVEVVVNSLDETADVHGLSLVQNPVSTNIELRFDASRQYQMQLQIIDISGRSILTSSIAAGQAQHMEDVSKLVPGQYMLHVSSSLGLSSIPFVISR